MQDYDAFIESKIKIAGTRGFTVDDAEINPILKPFQRIAVRWAIAGGNRALFESFGLGKTVQGLEYARLVLKHTAAGVGRALIVAPLGVRQEFKRDAKMLGIPLTFIRETAAVYCKTCKGKGRNRLDMICTECGGAGVITGIYLTNYESIREGKLDLSLFQVIVLDEASVLRSFGSKTFGEFLFGSVQKIPYRLVATATPSPNDYQELLAYAHFLGVMEIGEARTRFFGRNSEKSDDLTLLPNMEKEFWLWVASWALFLQKPSELGDSDEGYDLPPMRVIYHEVKVDHAGASPEKTGQGRLYKNAKFGAPEAARVKRETLAARIGKMREILDAARDDHFLIWHDLEPERFAIEKAVPEAVTVFGKQPLDEREQAIIDFSEGRIQYLAAKPVIAGSGCNFQRHCHKAIFLGVGYKFNDFIQSIYRIVRYLQTFEVEIHIIYADSEALVLQTLKEKWERDTEQRRIMSEIVRKYGLASDLMRFELAQEVGTERKEVVGKAGMFRAVLNDTVRETRSMPDNIITGMILTSIPFANQYRYTTSKLDFGFSANNEAFFAQMDYLTPELLRVLEPGRDLCVHVKDRIVDSGISNLGFQTVYPFHMDCVRHYLKHGFAFLGEKVIVTDVVRENNQTYRLGWSEQLKDGSRMGAGLPEYLLIFRKPQTDRSKGYADRRVEKSAEDFSLGRWQIDANGFDRVSGDRLLTPSEVTRLTWSQLIRLHRKYSRKTVYDYEKHVALCEALDAAGNLPTDFALIPPESWHPDVWTDITRFRTLNSTHAQQGMEKHICPLQFDLVDRAIRQRTMPGEIVFDPFAGIFTVPYRAVLLGRQGWGVELNPVSWADGVKHCEAAENKVTAPTLFDLLETEESEEVAA